RGHIDRMRVGIGALKEQAACQAAIDSRLESVVDAVRAAIPFPRGRGASEFGEEWASVIAGARDLRSVDVQKGEAVHGRRADVSNGGYEIARQLALDDQIPRLDVAPMQLP